mgnify:CR=1 FL=1
MKFDKEKMRLYAITDRHWLNGRSLGSGKGESGWRRNLSAAQGIKNFR